MRLSAFYKSRLFLNIIFIVSIAVIFFIAAITYKQILNLNQSVHRLEHSYKVSLELEQLNILVKDLETLKRDYLLTHDAVLVNEIDAKKIQITEKVNKIKQATADNIIQQQNVDSLEQYIQTKFNIVNWVIQQKSFAPSDQLLKENLMKGKKIMAQLKYKIDQMIVVERNLLEIRKNYNEKNLKTTPLLLYITLLIVLTLLALAFSKINQDLKRIQRINNKLTLSDEVNSFGEIVGNYGNWQWNVVQNTYYFSDNLYRLLGEQPQTFPATSENFMAFVHPDDVVFVAQETKKMEKTAKVPSFKYRILKKNGEILYIRATGKSLINKSGEKIIIGTNLDITEDVLTAKELEHKNRHLEQSNKELSAFNYIASHDLQEPLRKIQTFISRIVDKELPNLSENGKEYLNRVSVAAERMRELINDLLQFSRLGSTNKNFENISLNDILQQSVTELTALIEDKKVVIRNEQLPEAMVIPFQISQLFNNLLNNAIKYAHPDRVPQIDITSRLTKGTELDIPTVNKNRNYYHIQFKDNGIGFDNQYKNKIFEPFYRLHDKQTYQGSGIGLAICKKIMDNHNGFIYAESIANQGAIFHILLPAND